LIEAYADLWLGTVDAAVIATAERSERISSHRDRPTLDF